MRVDLSMESTSESSAPRTLARSITTIKAISLSSSSSWSTVTTNSFGQMWVQTVRCLDCAVFNQCVFKRSIENRTFGFPDPESLPFDDENMPYFLVGDDTFPLKTWMMKPFAHRNQTHEEAFFNYRLSRARRIVENCFTILVHRWRCLLGTLQQEPDTCTLIVKACLCLHNLMRLRYPGLQDQDADQEDAKGNVIPGAWRNNAVLDEMRHESQGGNLRTRDAKLRGCIGNTITTAMLAVYHGKI